jgi:hypothetical protein
MTARGIVVAPRFEFDGQTLHFPGLVGVEAEDLRKYLLYWDKIDYPNNNLIGTGTGPNEHFLIEAGVLRRTDIRFTSFSGNIGYGYILAQAQALQINNQREPGLWSMVQTANRLFLPSEVSHETRALEIELYNVLPVPSEEVSLEDILRFKERRNDELLALRAAMDELYLEVIDSSDVPRAKTAALRRLENSLRNLHTATNESWASKLLASLRVELNMPNIATHAVVGAALAPTVLDISPSLGAALGATAAAIKFEFRTTRKADALPPELKDFAYLQSAERELIT